MMSEFTNALHGTAAAVDAFARAHPDETIVASSATKAVRSDRAQAVERGLSWVGARRGSVIVSTGRVTCGDWEIPIAEIASAELLGFRTLLSRGLILRLATTGGTHYQFGLRDHPVWAVELPFPVTRGTTRLGMSAQSIGIRVVLVALMLWWVARKLGWL